MAQQVEGASLPGISFVGAFAFITPSSTFIPTPCEEFLNASWWYFVGPPPKTSLFSQKATPKKKEHLILGPMRRALFPGSFDPITLGHIEIIQRGLALFDEIIVGIGINTSKQAMFSPEVRQRWIEKAFENEPRVRVACYTNLTVLFAREVGAKFILRGLRSAPDYEYERNIDLLNKQLDPAIETLYLLSSPQTSFVSSTLVREVIRFRGRLEGLLPPHIIEDIYKLYPGGKPITG